MIVLIDQNDIKRSVSQVPDQLDPPETAADNGKYGPFPGVHQESDQSSNVIA